MGTAALKYLPGSDPLELCALHLVGYISSLTWNMLREKSEKQIMDMVINEFLYLDEQLLLFL